MAHIALDQARIRSANLRQRLAGLKMNDLVDVHALIRLAPTQNGNVNHQIFLSNKGSYQMTETPVRPSRSDLYSTSLNPLICTSYLFM